MNEILEINGTIFLKINSDTIEENLRFAEKNKIFNFLISARIGNYKLNNIDFVKDFPQLEKLYVSVYENINYQAIKHLKNLNTLSIDVLSNDAQEIDFSNLLNLQKLVFTWRNKAKNIHCLKLLKDLTITKFSKINLTLLLSLENLEDLGIFQSKIENLEGIEKLLNLKKLTIVDCRKLENIDSLGSLENLHQIKIHNCGNIKKPGNIMFIIKIELLESSKFI
ncbi:hypothetical protein [Halpernia frigidisoli]|nr:hypothetical protein [Halpernia frigidisoli]